MSGIGGGKGQRKLDCVAPAFALRERGMENAGEEDIAGPRGGNFLGRRGIEPFCGAVALAEPNRLSTVGENPGLDRH